MRVEMSLLLVLLLAACSRTSVAPFPELDRNHDGRISREEAAQDPALAKAFARIDKDKDGELTPREYLRTAESY